MKVRFELLTLFRQRAGTEGLEVEVPAPCTVAEALRALGAAAPALDGLLEGERIREGVLVFRKGPNGATQRVARPAAQTVGAGEALVLSTAMGGG